MAAGTCEQCPSFNVSGGSVFYKHKSVLNGTYIDGMIALVSCPHGSYPDGPTRAVCVKEKGWSSVAKQCISKYSFYLVLYSHFFSDNF